MKRRLRGSGSCRTRTRGSPPTSTTISTHSPVDFGAPVNFIVFGPREIVYESKQRGCPMSQVHAVRNCLVQSIVGYKLWLLLFTGASA